MKKIKVGIVGFGFIGPHHMEAIHRTGLAEVVALATGDQKRCEQLAEQHEIEYAFGGWEGLVASPEVEVVVITTPTNLHARIAIAAAEKRKHVIVDKPMALTSAEAKRMHDAAAKAGVINAVTFSIRYNVMLQQARAMVAKGDVGRVHFIHGHYFQEWLLHETDFNWRIDPEIGGDLAMVADAGAHWYDMVQHVTGLKVVRVLADLSRFMDVRKRPRPDGEREDFQVQTPDLGIVVFEFNNGARGMFATGAMHAGHKNDLTIEINGSKASVRWQQETPNSLWVGRRDEPNQEFLKDPALLDPSVAPYAKLPAGHNEAWPDAFRNLMSNIFGAIRDETEPGAIPPELFPTFATGLQITRIVDAIARSAAEGGVWTEVEAP